MSSPSRKSKTDPKIDPEALARLVVQCREFRTYVEKLLPVLPAKEDTPFLFRQLDEARSHLIDELTALGKPSASANGKEGSKGGFFARFRKKPSEPESPSEQKRVDLQGNSWTIPVPELIGFLSTSRKTGVLLVHANSETFLVEIKQGKLLAAKSDRPPKGSRLGEILVTRGVLTEEEIGSLVESAKRAKEPLGTHLVKTGRISAADRRAALAEQVQGLFHRLTTAENAVFRFQEGIDAVQAKDLELNVTHLLLESARFHDEEMRDTALDGLDAMDDGKASKKKKDDDSVESQVEEMAKQVVDSEKELPESDAA